MSKSQGDDTTSETCVFHPFREIWEACKLEMKPHLFTGGGDGNWDFHRELEGNQ